MSRKPGQTAEPAPTAETPIATFKGFDADLSCRGHKFEIGGTYSVSGKIKACSNGFHACENLWDVLSYYPLVGDDGQFNRYAEVEQSGDISRHGDDSKVASTFITVKAELRFPEVVSRLGTSLIENVASVVKGVMTDEGPSARIGSSGPSAQIGSSGHAAQIGSSGDAARIGSSGPFARIGSSGHAARIEAKGENAVVACAGRGATVSGAVGTWVSIAEYDEEGRCIGFGTGQIGAGDLKPDTAYRASGGKLVPA